MLRLFSRQQPEASAPVADEVRSLASPEYWLLDLFGAASAQAGVSVTPATVMRSTAVRPVVEAIAEAIDALPPFPSISAAITGHWIDHPAYGLLHDNGPSQGTADG